MKLYLNYEYCTGVFSLINAKSSPTVRRQTHIKYLTVCAHFKESVVFFTFDHSVASSLALGERKRFLKFNLLSPAQPSIRLIKFPKTYVQLKSSFLSMCVTWRLYPRTYMYVRRREFGRQQGYSWRQLPVPRRQILNKTNSVVLNV